MCHINSQFTLLSHHINHPNKHQLKLEKNVRCFTEQHRGQLTLCKDWTIAQSCKIGEAAFSEPIFDCTD